MRFGRRVVGALATTISLVACSTGPLQSTGSLSEAIEGHALGYDTTIEETSEKVMLLNIVRSSEFAPLSLSDFSSLSGALSVQATLGFSLPFGPFMGSTSRDTATPSINGGTAPTFQINPLTTEGVSLNLVQPVSASYVLNLWHAGVSPELLMLLFVKEIDFPVGTDTAPQTVRYINDPDNPERFNAFRGLIETILASSGELKAFDILDPVGGPFDLYSPKSTSSDNDGTQPNTSAYQMITGNNDGQYHAGNATNGLKTQAQLYRVYSNQVAICVDSGKMQAARFPIADIDSGKVAPSLADKIRKMQKSEKSMLAVLGAEHGPPPSNSGTSNQPPGNAPASPKTPGAQASTPGNAAQALTAALSVGRISTLVDGAGCGPAEIVLTVSSEELFQKSSMSFVHVEWRSVSEVFDFLGAVLRYNKKTGNPINWADKSSPLIATASGTAPLGATDVIGCLGPSPNPACAAPPPAAPTHILFQVFGDRDGLIGVDYKSAFYSIHASAPSAIDDTRKVLQMLSPLVNVSKASGDITNSQPLRLLPIP